MSQSSFAGLEKFAPSLSGADYGEVFLEKARGLSLRFEDSKIQETGALSQQGLGLRFLRRGKNEVETLQGSSQSLNPDDAAALYRRLWPKAPAGASVELKPFVFKSNPVRVPPEEVPTENKVALLRAIDKTLRAEFPNLRQVSLSYSESQREIALANSEGAHQAQKKVAVLFSVSVVAEENGVLQTGYEVLGALKGYELIEDSSPLELARQAAKRALAKLKAPKAKAAEMPIVMAASAGGTFIHEAIGHSLEADHVQEGSSPAYRGKIGSAIACEKISVIDDPTLPFYRGSFFFDDDGIEARATILVENGILKDYLYDRVTALKENKISNGHGRRESFHSHPIPRMSNLYIAPGPDDPQKILKDLDRGLLVTRMGGGQVNTANGEFVFEVDEGFWVEQGKIRHMVRDANLLGIGPEILKSIDKVGWDIGWGIGTCGKDGQGVPVGDGQPTIHIPKILIGGAHE